MTPLFACLRASRPTRRSSISRASSRLAAAPGTCLRRLRCVGARPAARRAGGDWRGAGAHRLPYGGVPCHPLAAEDRDLGRHRPVHRVDRLRRRRLRPPYPRRAEQTVPVQLGDRRLLPGWPVLVFLFGLVLVIALWVRRVRGAILISIVVTTVLAMIVEAIGDSAFGDRTTRRGWGLNVPVVARQGLRHARTSAPSATSACSAAFEDGRRRHRRCC